MNNTQIQVILAPIIGAIATYLASKFPLLDQAAWNTLVNTIVLSAISAYLGFITKKTSLADTLGKIPDTTVITDKATADALPANASVVANTEVKVTPK